MEIYWQYVIMHKKELHIQVYTDKMYAKRLTYSVSGGKVQLSNETDKKVYMWPCKQSAENCRDAGREGQDQNGRFHIKNYNWRKKNMKTKKVLSVLLVAAMTTAMVCGCGSSDSKGDSQTAKATESDLAGTSITFLQ